MVPHYNKHVAPYIEPVLPYASSAHQQVILPSWEFGKNKYNLYGAPRVDQARQYGQSQWEKTLKPQVDAAHAKAQQRYETSVAPYLHKIPSITVPYYSAGRDNVYGFYSGRVLPAYDSASPYFGSAYAVSHTFLSDHAIPHVQTAWDSSMGFVYRILLPEFRILYGENVEPQIVKITERLANYRDGKKLQAGADDMEAKLDASTLSSSLSSVSSSVISSSITTATTPETAVSASSSPSASPEEVAAQTREKVKADLKAWQDKFAKAADKGSEDLLERVNEIISRQISHQVQGVGDSMVIQLEETCKSEVVRVKSDINAVVGKLSSEPSEDEEQKAEEQISQAVKKAGMTIRDKAIALRQWKQNYDIKTHSLVSSAAQNTVAVLDSIKDVGLSEIGMRWAWMDGITYKDWAKYHGMKDTFDDWRREVETVALEHQGLRESIDASSKTESKGMAATEAAAKELNRLKEVAKWKIRAGDSSDDFGSKVLPPRAAKVGQKVMEGVTSASEQIMGSSPSSIESISSVGQGSAAQVVSSASSIMVGEESRTTDKAKTSLDEASSAASEKLANSIRPDAESIVSAAREKAEQIAHEGSKAFASSSTPVHESILSEASSQASSAGDAASRVASEALSASNTPPLDSASSVASGAVSSASTAGTASSKVFAGAMAEDVKEQKPILDDLIDEDSTYSEKVQSIVGQAGDKYSDITRAVSEALARSTKTQGTAESITSVADVQFSSALDAASRVLYGSEQGTVESASSVAAGKYSEAVAA